MHITFRELAQRMGLQTARAIYNEDIDICLNHAIMAKTRSIISQNAQTANDYIIKANADISQLNALRNFAMKGEISGSSLTGGGTDIDPYTADVTNANVMLYTHFAVSYDDKTLDDCRIIEAEYLQRTLRDYCNRATKRYPICVSIVKDGKHSIEIYNGNSNSKPTKVVYNYIKLPAVVKYDEQVIENRVNCDLPDYLHMEIVELAIAYFRDSFAMPNEPKIN